MKRTFRIKKKVDLQSVGVALSGDGAHGGGEDDHVVEAVAVDEVDELVAELPHLA